MILVNINLILICLPYSIILTTHRSKIGNAEGLTPSFAISLLPTQGTLRAFLSASGSHTQKDVDGGRERGHYNVYIL